MVKGRDGAGEMDDETGLWSGVGKEDTEMLFFGNCEEIGPTPQKIGRPIGIFDDIYSDSYALWKEQDEDREDMATPVKRVKDIEKVRTPIKTPDRGNLTTPAFLKKSMDITSSISPKFSFRKTLLCKKSLSSLMEELRQIEQDHFVDPQVLREIENQNSNRSMEEKEKPAEEIVSEDKPWKKKGIRRSKRKVILRPIIKKEGKKEGDQSVGSIDKKTLKKNHVHKDKTLNDKGDTRNSSRHKRYIKGKGGVFLSSQVSRNYVSYKLKKYNKSRFRKK